MSDAYPFYDLVSDPGFPKGDPEAGYGWKCPDCESWATLPENARAHRWKTGHAVPHQEPLSKLMPGDPAAELRVTRAQIDKLYEERTRIALLIPVTESGSSRGLFQDLRDYVSLLEKNYVSRREKRAAPTWTEDWPTEPGWYWLYGQPHGPGKDRLCMAQVRMIQTGPLVSADGGLIFKGSAGRCFWQRTTAPEVPGQ